MSFDVVFVIAAALVGGGFVTVFALIGYGAIRSATDPAYRARLAARPRPAEGSLLLDDAIAVRPGDPV